jgi:hypothetical protein
VIHILDLRLPQWLNLERRTAGMQQSPVVEQFIVMDLCPRLDKALLRSRKRASDALYRIEGEHCLEFLIDGMKVRPMMWRADFWKHADDDSKEP